MVFSSMTFLFVFLPVVTALYFLVPKPARNGVLLAASLLFYAWGEPKFVVLMVISVLVNYAGGLMIERSRASGGTGKAALIGAVTVDLVLLGIFKYANFVVDSVNSALSSSLSIPEIALPIGISFYTFQNMSYIIDVYRGDTEAQHDLIDFAAYVTMFPQLIAGPIVRYSQVAEELNSRELSFARFGAGAQRFITGLGKKVIFANQAGSVWEQISAMESPSAATALIGAVFFTFQIYFDFSGYSDMAIGLGKMLGFTFPENFDHPYTCRSITEFWRRWHMTLGSWFREYVYIPLGGSYNGMLRQLRNIAVVWALTGLWHGAAWNFVFWGLYYGLILVLEKVFLLRALDRIPERLQWLRHLYTLPVILVGWVLFASADLQSLTGYLAALFGANGALDPAAGFYLRSWWMPMILMAAACTELPANTAAAAVGRMPEPVKAVTVNLFLGAVFLLSLAFLVGDSYNPFLYFRF